MIDSMDESYVVEKQALPLFVNIDLNEELFGECFIPIDADTPLIGRLKTAFKEYATYMPFRLQSSKIIFINKKAIAYFKIPNIDLTDLDTNLNFDSEISCRVPVEIIFTKGTTIRGTINGEIGDGAHKRFSDCLNRSCCFLGFMKNNDFYLIANSFISWIKELEDYDIE